MEGEKIVIGASLIAGALGGGRLLFAVVVSRDRHNKPSAEQWRQAMDLCLKKAEELRFEVVRIYGQRLANYLLDEGVQGPIYYGKREDKVAIEERRRKQGRQKLAEIKMMMAKKIKK
ncbi:hypothetical protein ACQ5EN_004155 [Salmonella enterica subsp. enterica serovar Newport]